jgi:hypothetical protein
MLRRLIELECIEVPHARRMPHLIIVTASVGDRNSRENAWRQLVLRLSRNAGSREIPTTVLDWHQVADLLGGVHIVAARSNIQRGSTRRRSTPAEMQHTDELFNLLGRHPLLTIRQLALLMAVATQRVRQLRKQLVTRGLVRTQSLAEPNRVAWGTPQLDEHRLDLAELSPSGCRHLAISLGLPVAVARRHHGLFGGSVAQRRRVKRAVAHTIGANEIFVAMAVQARVATGRGADEVLEVWRSAAACERRYCKPDGYGCFRRGNLRYGFLLEYDRGTERAAQYRAKLMAYLAYARSGLAARDFQGFPTILFVTTSPAAEERIARVAARIWARMGYAALPLLTTTTERIRSDERGILGPIWRCAGDFDDAPDQLQCWPPNELLPGRLSEQH